MKNKKPPIGIPNLILTGKDADRLFEEAERPIILTPEKIAEMDRCKKLAKRFFKDIEESK